MKCILIILLSFIGLESVAQSSFTSVSNLYTKEKIEYIEVTTDLLGKPFAKTFIPDGVLFIRREGKIFKAQTPLPNVYKAEWFGMIPGKDGTEAMERIKKTFPSNYPFELRLEIGRYTFSKPLQLKAMPLRLVGVYSWGWEGNTTELYFSATDGFSLLGCNGAHFENLRIRGNGKGRGLLISSVMTMQNVAVTHFAAGVEIYGDIFNGNKLDASRGRYNNLSIAVCKTGMRVVGGDANQNSFYDLDVRDIDSIGLIESSFLGNSYYSAHFNNCKKGPFVVTDPNAVCTFYDVYGEQGMPPARVTKNTQIVGNRLWCGVQGGFVQRGTAVNEMIANKLLIGEGISLYNDYGGYFNFSKNKKGVWEFNYSNLDWTKILLLKPGDEWRGKKVTTPAFGFELSGQLIPLIK